jgi:hypothetical protein
MRRVIAAYPGDPDAVRVDPSMVHGMEGMEHGRHGGGRAPPPAVAAERPGDHAAHGHHPHHDGHGQGGRAVHEAQSGPAPAPLPTTRPPRPRPAPRRPAPAAEGGHRH